MAGFLGLAQGATSILGGLKGLFGGGDKPKTVTPYNQIHSQAAGAKDAAAKYGFNPLTLLQAGAGNGYAQLGGGAGPAPLASISMLTEGLQSVSDVVSGDAAKARAREQLETDLLSVQLDEARARLANPRAFMPATDQVGGSPSPLGRRAATATPVNGATHSKRFAMADDSALTEGRKTDIAPVTNSPGVFTIQNGATLGKPVTIPGEGEPWGIDELATAGVFGIPQVLGGIANDYFFDGKRVDEWARDKHAEQEAARPERERREREETKKRQAEPGWMENLYGKGHF
ncbi:DNA pilot protein [Flyfo microvirus Tbat2_93]|nr:DNA pilot protein [Flyfo microvirus Tbat2_93]